jgi:ubiquinone/menaquinone biosynthesis C-methylase UbiE
MIKTRTTVENFYDTLSKDYDRLKQKNQYYHKQIKTLYQFLIPKQQTVLEIGCATGELLASLHPAKGVGVDISARMIDLAKKKYPRFIFKKGSAEDVTVKGKFDYIILSDVVGILDDIQQTFHNIYTIATPQTRIIISFYNYLWEPFLVLAGILGLKVPQPQQSWVSNKDIENLLELSDLEVVKQSTYLLLPFYIPVVSSFINKYIGRLPLIRNLCFIRYMVIRKKLPLHLREQHTVSIIMPARNEAGNIEKAVKEIPTLGKKTEIIFVEGHSTDTTRQVIQKVIQSYKGPNRLRLFIQKKQRGKGPAVRTGFKEAKGEVLIIFDADLTTDAKDLPKFYNAIRDKKAEFIQGSRLVYPMEKNAMKFLNTLGNKFFSITFSFLLDQRIKDTLCGTKVLFKNDYERIAKNRSYFGNFDPFGDFDLIFGAAKLNLKIMEIPVRYKARSYGQTNISRFRNGALLLRMTIFAARKIKFF